MIPTNEPSSAPNDAAELTLWGRRIHGPTLPGQGIRCKRESPLSPSEIEETAEIIARARIERRSASLPERLKTRHWGSVMAVMARLNEKLGWPSAGWKIGAAAEEIRRAEGARTSAGEALQTGRLCESSAVASQSVHQLPLLRMRVCLPHGRRSPVALRVVF